MKYTEYKTQSIKRAIRSDKKTLETTIDIRVYKLQILNSGKQVWMLPLTKLIRTVGGGFRRKKMVQTVTWLSDLPKEFAI